MMTASTLEMGEPSTGRPGNRMRNYDRLRDIRMNESGSSQKPPTIPGYTIESSTGPIGKGGMGVVWKAHQQGTNRIVAVKMILGRGKARRRQMLRFRHEAKLISQVQDPHVIQVFHTGNIRESRKGQVKRLPYLVMEFVGGGTLADRMGSKKYLPRARPPFNADHRPGNGPDSSQGHRASRFKARQCTHDGG